MPKGSEGVWAALIAVTVVLGGLGAVTSILAAPELASAAGSGGAVPASGVGHEAAPAAAIVPAGDPEVYDVVFQATNLSSNGVWTVQIGSQYVTSTSPTITFDRANGVYTYYVTPPSGFEASPAIGTVEVSGADPEPVDVNFEYLYSVTVHEVGIPAGTATWGIQLGSVGFTTSATSFSIGEPNGTYAFTTICPSSYSVNVSSGTFTISGGGEALWLGFSPVTFNVTFSESGLPSGTVWTITASGPAGSIAGSSSGPNLTLSLLNGTYSYTGASTDSSYATPGGSFEVSGEAETISVVFALGGTAVFNETGLPAGSLWYLNITGQPSLSTTGTTISTYLTNGVYTYLAQPANHSYFALSGSVTVKGSGTSVTLGFGLQYYNVVVQESGLPSGARWWFNISWQGSSWSTTSKTIGSGALPNGTYEYTASAKDTLYGAKGGSFTVDGASVIVSVTFALLVWTVTFLDSGLPSGTGWTVTVAGESPVSSSTTTNTISLSNGTYGYTASSSNTAYAAGGGSFKVSGATLEIEVYFSEGVTFTVTGLPSDDTWTVTFNGTTVTTSGNSIQFNPGGSNGAEIPYFISDPEGLALDPTTGNLSLGAAAQTVNVAIGHPYVVTFKGAASGFSWGVEVGGVVESGYGWLFFTQPNGTFGYTPEDESGTYDGSSCVIAPTSGSGTFKVSAGDVSVTVAYASPSSICVSGGGGGGCSPLRLVVTPCFAPIREPPAVGSLAKIGAAQAFGAAVVAGGAVVVAARLRSRPPASGVSEGVRSG